MLEDEHLLPVFELAEEVKLQKMVFEKNTMQKLKECGSISNGLQGLRARCMDRIFTCYQQKTLKETRLVVRTGFMHQWWSARRDGTTNRSRTESELRLRRMISLTRGSD